MKNSFSFKRLWQYAKAEFMSSRRLVLLLLVSIVGVCMVSYYINHLAEYESEPSQWYNDYTKEWVTSNMDVSAAVVFVWFMIMVTSVINISRSFKNYFSKGYANATMMMPVSLSEKFTYSLIINSFIVPLILVSIGALNDLIWTSFYGIDFSFIKLDEYTPFMALVMAACSMLFMLSQYFFGSILFRRYQLLFTIIAQFAIGVVIMIFGFWIAKLDIDFKALIPQSLIDWIRNLYEQYGHETMEKVALAIGSFLFLAAASVLWLISWKRFRKLQITK